MKTKHLNSTELAVISSNVGLSSYLNNLQIGRRQTPHSWLYEREDAETTFERWIPIMKKANASFGPLGSKFTQFDLRQVVKTGPQGEIPPIESEEAQEVLEPIYTPSKYDDENALSEYFPAAQEYAREIFGARLCTKRPLSFSRVVDDMRSRDTLTTNSGWNRFTRRMLVSKQAIQDAESGAAYEYPAIVLFRKYNGKLRPVWMYPMAMNLIEGSFQQVVQAEMRQTPSQFLSNYLSPWVGYDEVKETLTTQWPRPAPIVGGDTTKMDAHMRRAQIRLVFEIVKWLFQKVYWNDLWKAMSQVNSIELLVGPNRKAIGLHGLASGSNWTQITETILTSFMAWLKALTGQGIGDDFTWNTSMTASELVDYLNKFGLPANADKQDVSNVELTFLQRMNHQGFFSRENPKVLGGYYPTIRALNSSLWPEKFHRPKDWNSDMFCARQFMILENCVDDPCFDEFVAFVVNGHKDLVTFAKKSAKELTATMRKARLIPGLNPTYNQEKRDKPLSEFASIKLAKQM
nr:MAG: RNA-dependent RNA-polymerase [Picobirnavirus sp.]